jgi:Zn-dependent protease with chaperone function
MKPVNLTGLRPQVYEHSSDKSALDVLSNTGGLDAIVRKLNAWGFERFLCIELTGSYLRVTAESFPDLHQILQKACAILDIPEEPGLYIAPGTLNAFTAGVDKPLIVLNSGIIDAMSDEELLFVIAHELGHIKSAHVLYYQLAKFVPVIAEYAAHLTLGISDLFGTGLEMALLHWQRMAEFTADRAGLLGCQDADVALRALMKLAGLPTKYYGQINTADFIAQARAFNALDQDKLTMVAKLLTSMGATHPYTVMRGKQLLDWHDSGGYEQVLRAPRSAPPPLPPGVSRFCTTCGYPLRGNERFCPGCARSLVTAATA